MKFKYIFASIAAALALAVSCTKEADQHFLKEIQVSTSYLSLPVDGGTAVLTVTATDSWTFDKAVNLGTDKEPDMTELPTWLTASMLSGGAGETKITFSAAKALDGRSAELVISCAGKTQRINVIQGLSVVSNATCAEVIAGPESKTYRVTGTVTKIANTVYGNWYLQDETGEIYIYGTLDSKGATKNFLSWGLEEGDEITVEGPKTVYNGTVELVDVTVVNINKSLIKVAEVTYPSIAGVDEDVDYLDVDGGSVTVSLESKGHGIYAEVPGEAADWLTIGAVAGNAVVFKAARNQGGDREATVVFKTYDDKKKEYSCKLTITQKGSILDITAVDFNALPDGTALYRIKGIITSIVMDKTDPTKYNKYGNFYIQDGTGEVYVYGLLPEAGGASGQDVLGTKGIKPGDMITVVGPKGSYKESPQMVNGYYVEHVSVGTATAAEFNALDDGSDLYQISGTVAEIVMDKNDPTLYNKYGNFYVEDQSGRVYVYGLVPVTGTSGTDMLTKLGVKVGDSITLVGPKGSYKGSPQMVNAYYVSHEAPSSGTITSPYVLTVTAGENNSYAGNCDITIGGIVWNMTGNSTMNPWRIGGKGLTDKDIPLYSKSAISFDVSKIEVQHGAATGVTVNSYTLIVSANNDFSSPVSTLTGTFEKDATATFNRPDAVSWKNCYFKFVYNVTIESASANRFIEFKQASFTE